MLRLVRLACFGLVAVGFVATPVLAQPALQTVLDLNRQGMDRYNELEIEDALAKLRQALDVCDQRDVAGTPRARTLVNIGIVQVGGFQDRGAGLEAFRAALRIDPEITLDPLTATPEITTVFGMARASAGEAASPPGPTPGPPSITPTQPPAPAGPPPPMGEAPGQIPHTPHRQQLARTAVPVYVEVPEDAPVVAMTVFYKSTGYEYQELPMERMTDGFGVEIPCTDVFQPNVEYYIRAYGEGNAPLGFKGTPEQPVVVPIVSERTGAEPALPGRPAPETCSEDECPPGMPGCEAEEGEEEAVQCVADSNCPLDFVCDQETSECVFIDDVGYDDEEEEGSGEDAPAFFFHAMGVWGSAFVDNGMLSDSPPAMDPSTGEPFGAWVPEAANMDDAMGAPECADNGDTILDYCVNVVDAGFVPTFGLRAAIGYYFGRFGIAGFARWQPNAGQGTLAGLLFGVRVQILATDPSPTGFHFAPFLGTSVGQIQPQPSQDDGLAPSEGGPFVRTGLNGVQLGGVFGYRFWRFLGLVVTAETMLQFPIFLLNFDLSGGIEIAF